MKPLLVSALCLGLGAACSSEAPSHQVGSPSLEATGAPARVSAGEVTRPEASSEEARSEAPAKPSADPRSPTQEERARYAWLSEDVKIRPLSAAIPAPRGFHRVEEKAGSFGAFLRDLPLRPEGTPVLSYRGALLLKGDDPRITAVAELDVGTADLQQCADSVIRLHAEWLWSRGDRDRIAYHFLSGDLAAWPRFAAGERVVAKGNRVTWAATARAASDHATFRKYLDTVFNYASTISVERSSSLPVDKKDLAPGDFFILPGGPGHTVLVLDVAVDDAGHKVGLLGQGYMPAQDFHVLAAPKAEDGSGSSPWFDLGGASVDTPFWPAPFPWSSLHRLK